MHTILDSKKEGQEGKTDILFIYCIFIYLFYQVYIFKLFFICRLAMILERNRKSDKPDDFVCYESSGDEEETVMDGIQYLKTSFSFVDYVRSRETNTREIRKINQEFGSRHILSHDLFKEYSVSLNNMNKVFCSQWLSDRQVVFGTKCNKLMVYDVATQKLDQIPSLHGRQNSSNGLGGVAEQQCGIHSVQINPSRYLLIS